MAAPITNDIIRKRKRSVITMGIILAVVLILVAIYSIVTLIYRAGKIEVKVLYAPYAATVKIDDRQLTNNSTEWIAPGTYHLTVSFNEHFTTVDTEVTVSEEKNAIYGFITPLDEEGQKYARDHIKEYDSVSGIAGRFAAESGKKQHEKYPLMGKLPVKTPHYTLSYSMPSEDEFKLTLTATIGYRGMATRALLDILSDKDLQTYDVVVSDVDDSPFEGKFTENKAEKLVDYIKTGYGAALNGYTVNEPVNKGLYYYGVITKQLKYYKVVYRYVATKDNATGQWKLYAKPYPFVSGKLFKEVKGEILRDANLL